MNPPLHPAVSMPMKDTMNFPMDLDKTVPLSPPVNIPSLMKQQRAFAASNQACDLDFRRAQLQKLKAALRQHEEALFEAIYADFRKSRFETYMTELGLVHHEIDSALKNLKRWSKPKRVSTGLANFPGASLIVPEPYGTTLIIGAWNYPYQLTLAPLVAAMAAGNTAVVKPSELPSRTAHAMAQMINGIFDPGYLHVVEGGVEVTQQLLSQRYDKIFFTGSTAVGKIVAKAAAEHLTPVTLELGGKSPCIVMDDIDLERTAQRIVWGKFLNAGQTCIAPDYLLVQQKVYEPLLNAIREQITKIVGENPMVSESYPRIINDRHVSRLQALIDPSKVYTGGGVNAAERYIEPTVLRDVRFSDEIMKEEIFGPLLPVIPFTDLTAVLSEVASRPKPLALYIFTKSNAIADRVMRDLHFGGGTVNDVIMHITNPKLPFGGVGNSGMGSYHGEFGFQAFSHMKSVLKKPFWLELPVKYQPYSAWKMRLVRFLLG